MTCKGRGGGADHAWDLVRSRSVFDVCVGGGYSKPRTSPPPPEEAPVSALHAQCTQTPCAVAINTESTCVDQTKPLESPIAILLAAFFAPVNSRVNRRATSQTFNPQTRAKHPRASSSSSLATISSATNFRSNTVIDEIAQGRLTTTNHPSKRGNQGGGKPT